MHRLAMEMVIAAPVEKVWAFHADVGNLVRVFPTNMRPQLLKLHERFEPGAEFVLRLGFGYWLFYWHGRIAAVDPPVRFADEQVSGPFAAFEHEHRFEPLPDGRTRIVERLDYRLRWGPLGRMANALFFRWQFRAMCRYRRRILPRLLES